MDRVVDDEHRTVQTADFADCEGATRLCRPSSAHHHTGFHRNHLPLGSVIPAHNLASEFKLTLYICTEYIHTVYSVRTYVHTYIHSYVHMYIHTYMTE